MDQNLGGKVSELWPSRQCRQDGWCVLCGSRFRLHCKHRYKVGLQCRGPIVSVDLAHLPSLEYGHGYRQVDFACNSC